MLARPAEGGRPHVDHSRLDQFPEDGAARLQLVLQSQHGGCDGAGFGSGQANYSDAAPAGGSGDCDDSVVEVHRVILAVNGAEGDERFNRVRVQVGLFILGEDDECNRDIPTMYPKHAALLAPWPSGI